MEVSKCWKTVEFPKILIKMKNFKRLYEAQTVNRLNEIIEPLNKIKASYVSGTKFSYGD